MGIPLSNGYDFIGEPNHRIRREEPKEEPSVGEQPKEEPKETPKEEPAETPKPQPAVIDKPQPVVTPKPKPSVLPEPEESIDPISETISESAMYLEINYEDIDPSNPRAVLPASESGNYIIIYSTANCQPCERVINELKGKTDFPVVRIKCKQSVKDLYYERVIQSFPSWITICKDRVRYYGVGARTLEYFDRLFK